MNVFKISICHNNHIAQFVLDDLCCNWYNVWILDGCEPDEIVHRVIANGEWRIAVRVVLTTNRVVKVIT